MKQRSADWQVYVHVVLFLCACAFLIGLSLNNDVIISIFSKAMIAFWLINIPLGIISLVAVAKGRAKKSLSVPLSVLSVLNILVGLAAWVFLILLMKMP